MKHSNYFFKQIILIFAAVMMWSGDVWGNEWSIKMTVKPNTTGYGKVYVSKTSTTSYSWNDTESTAEESGDIGGRSDKSQTFYLYAQVESNAFNFLGWSTNKSATSDFESTTPLGFEKTLTRTGNDSGTNVDVTYYAIFAKYPTATLSVGISSGGVSDGCSVSVSNSTSAGSATSLTQYYESEKGGYVDFYLHATPNTFNHYVLAGWTPDAAGTTVESVDNPYKVTKATADGYDKDANYNYYALFKQLPCFKFDFKWVAQPSEGGTATITGYDTEIWGETLNVDKKSTTARYTATPTDTWYFKGWTTKSGGTELIYANPYDVKAENQTKGSTLVTTLYPQFARCENPTAVAFTETEKEVNVGGTTSASVVMTPNTSATYKMLRYSSANTSIASVDAETGVITGVNVGTTEITVKAYKVDKTTEACSAKITVKVMDKLAAPVISVEPNRDDDYNTGIVTITKGDDKSSGTYFRYTTDGKEPTVTVGTQYDAANKPLLANGATINVRAFCNGWYQSDVVSEQYNKQITSTPTITVTLNSSNKYEVTFSCKDDDVTFYYTTDGSSPTYDKTTGTPTGTTQKYSGAFVPAIVENVITVIATHDQWRDSDPATKNYVRASGVEGGVVYLNDYEDHTWTYYSGVDSKVDGGNYNTNYNGLIYSPNPRNLKITYQGNGGAVSIDNPNDATFVYYETLEQSNGKWLYTTIANPFSKRPVVGTGSDRWRGFSAWEVVSISKGSLKSADGGTTYGVGSQIPAETEIQCVPADGYTANCTSIDVVVKAVWVQAYRYTSASNSMSGGSYETNFVVATSGSVSVSSSSKPCTVMAVEPDGSADYRSNGSCSSISALSSGIVKMEYIKYTSSSSISPNGKDLYIGRGVTTSNSPSLVGCSSNTNVNELFKVGSGTYSSFYCYTTQVSGSKITKMVVVLGDDYDRASGTNSNLSITGTCHMENCTAISKTTDGDIFSVVIKSGVINSGVTHTTAKESGNCFYLWDNSGGGKGTRSLEIQGGELWNICGGADDENYDDNRVTLSYRMKGGTVHGCFYGGAASYESYGSKKFVFTGGKIEGWVAGGSDAYASSSGGGIVYGKTYLYIGGNIKIDSNGSTTPVDAGLGGTVFGAGIGKSGSLDGTIGKVNAGTNVVVADNSYVERGVYGGGSYGYTSEPSYMYVTGGHVEGKIGGVNGTSYDSSVTGGIYGGACKNKAGVTNVYMTGGIVEGGIYGGSNVSGTVSSVNMVIAGGQIGTKTNLTARACGGGYGTSTTISGNVNMTLGVSDLDLSPYFYGNCYGGSALGKVTGNVSLTINKGASYQEGTDNTGGEIFCGGLGQSGNTSYGTVGGTLTTVINGTDDKPGDGQYAYNHVYGGSHYINQTSTTPSVTVNDCNVSIKKLYGGSKEASLKATNITVNGGNTIGYVFGGSYKANITGDVTLKVGGGAAERVFGGNDESGTIGGTINMSIDKYGSCSMLLGEVYGGGNKADSKSTSITIGCPGYIGQLYGGANEANITGNITLNVYGGKYGAIFGGNNKSGTVSGTVTVNVGKETNNCELSVDTIFGGGNIADLAQAANKVTVNVAGDATEVGNVYGGGKLASVYSSNVNITGGTFSGNVFGGGMGSKATATLESKQMILNGGTNLNITGGKLTNVFGGNDAGGTIVGSLNTTINRAKSLDIYGDVYGGGNEANSAAGNLNITCVDSIGSVYGGAKNADITGDIALKIAAGRIGNVFGGNNLGGTISGTISIDVQHKDCSTISIGNLYGAGNLADYAAPATATYCPVINLKTCGASTVDWRNDGTHCMKVGTIYGAGRGAKTGEYAGKGKVTGNPQINVNAGEVGYIYGGGNAADVVGSTNVNVIDTATGDNQDIYVTGNIYGGGNEANVTGDTHVQIGQPK